MRRALGVAAHAVLRSAAVGSPAAVAEEALQGLQPRHLFSSIARSGMWPSSSQATPRSLVEARVPVFAEFSRLAPRMGTVPRPPSDRRCTRRWPEGFAASAALAAIRRVVRRLSSAFFVQRGASTDFLRAHSGGFSNFKPKDGKAKRGAPCAAQGSASVFFPDAPSLFCVKSCREAQRRRDGGQDAW